MALSHLVFGSPVFVGSFLGIDLRWTLTSNQGAAWGLFDNTPGLLFAFRVLFIFFLAGVYAFSHLSCCARTCLAVVLAGALGNLVDTMLWGHVVDMIHVTLWGWDYPVFNVADIGICLGCVGIVASPMCSSKS